METHFLILGQKLKTFKAWRVKLHSEGLLKIKGCLEVCEKKYSGRLRVLLMTYILLTGLDSTGVQGPYKKDRGPIFSQYVPSKRG